MHGPTCTLWADLTPFGTLQWLGLLPRAAEEVREGIGYWGLRVTPKL
jgi:hypothetical protein